MINENDVAKALRTLIRETNRFERVRQKGDSGADLMAFLADKVATHLESTDRDPTFFSRKWFESQNLGASDRTWNRAKKALNRVLLERGHRFAITATQGAPRKGRRSGLRIVHLGSDEVSMASAVRSRHDRGIAFGGRTFDATAVDWSDGGRTGYEPAHLTAQIEGSVPPPPEWALACAAAGPELPPGAFNADALCGIRELVPTLRGDNEDAAVEVVLYRHDYRHMVRTVLAVQNDASLRSLVLNESDEGLVPYFASAVGVVLWARTNDGWLVVADRSEKVAVRKGEGDASVVEGIHAVKDADDDDTIDLIATCVRGCVEELNVTPDRTAVKLLAIGRDLGWYQHNFWGIVDLPLTYDEVSEARGRSQRARRLETRAIRKIRADPYEAFRELADTERRGTKVWATAWASLFYALVYWSGGEDAAVESAARRAFDDAERS